MLFAYQLHEAGLVTPEAIKAAHVAGNLPAPLPGQLANGACGIAGLICVVIAGWTTANPTIYRAGLAFQAVIPKVSRFKVTLITGIIATIAAMFQALAMKLLDFVMLYGMLLMPMGAVVFIDFWVFRKIRLRSFYAEVAGKSFNLAAFLAWIITLGVCAYLSLSGMVQIYFVSLPGWFLASVLYIVLSMVYQKKGSPSSNTEEVKND